MTRADHLQARLDHVRHVLTTFHGAPISASTLQPVLDLARAFVESEAADADAPTAGPFACLYCGQACELDDCEPYCSPECSARADAESGEDAHA